MISITENADLSRRNTFGIEARCRRLVEYTDARADLPCLREEGLLQGPVIHLGGGANTLFTADFEGTVLHCADTSFSRDEEGRVTAGAGWNWDALVSLLCAEGLHGLENLSGIPGDLGGAVCGNIGAYGMEISQRIAVVEVFDTLTGEFVRMNPEECCFVYRDSIFKMDATGRRIITAATLLVDTPERFTPCLEYEGLRRAVEGLERITPADIRRAVMEQRDSKLPDPRRTGNAGSFFRNPIVEAAAADRLEAAMGKMPRFAQPDGSVKLSAGWLIDHCGWKGARRAGAGVDSRNALVLVNTGGATGSQILALADEIIKDIAAKTGIILRPEVKIADRTTCR